MAGVNGSYPLPLPPHTLSLNRPRESINSNLACQSPVSHANLLNRPKRLVARLQCLTLFKRVVNVVHGRFDYGLGPVVEPLVHAVEGNAAGEQKDAAKDADRA